MRYPEAAQTHGSMLKNGCMRRIKASMGKPKTSEQSRQFILIKV